VSYYPTDQIGQRIYYSKFEMPEGIDAKSKRLDHSPPDSAATALWRCVPEYRYTAVINKLN